MTDRPRWTQHVVDGVIAIAFLFIGWISTAAPIATESGFVYSTRDTLFAVLLAAATLPYAGRRHWPTAAFLTGLLATTGLWALGYNASTLPVLLLVGAYWVASARPVGTVVACASAALACFTLLLWVQGAPFGAVEWSAAVISVTGAIALGRAARHRGDLAEARAHAAEEAFRRRTSEERLQISAELHDIVGHSLGIIAVQAGVGRHLLATDRERAADALDAIARISRSSLDEVRGVVARLRDGDTAYHPVSGVGDLDVLVGTARSTGLAVSLTAPEDPQDIPRPVGAAVYRITQEALTNVVRHAHASHASVDIKHTADTVDVSIRDNGRPTYPGTAAWAPGHGIAGMRERAETLGGTFTAARDPHGGFRVDASLPLGRA